MADPIPVVLAKEGVSDDSFLFIEAVKAEGELTEVGECIARVETSKATIDVVAPCRGYIRYCYEKGAEIPVGEAIALISQQADFHRSGPAAGAPNPSRVPAAAEPSIPAEIAEGIPAPTRFTPLAMKMMAEFNLEKEIFRGGGLVKKERVLEMRCRSAPSHEEVSAPPPGSRARFSLAAVAELERMGLAMEAFDGAGLVTREDVRKRAGLVPPSVEKVRSDALPGHRKADSPQPPGDTRKVAAGEGERIPLSKAKKNEILSLQEGQKGVLASAITILVSSRGFFDAASRPLGNLLPILVYEIARLLRRFPEFNARFDGESVIHWAEANVGVAFEIDAGLKVPVIKGADAMGVAAIKESLDGHVMKYLENRLGLEDLSGATFTVTDLSGEGVFSFLPLINRGQSAILGVGGCLGRSRETAVFPLTLTFDHRVSTGRRASAFLRSLKERLESYGPVLSPEASLEE